MVDVDHFKQFNDVHGHLAGDEQLIRVARTLSKHARPVRELLARFGGEEFALVLPGTSLDQAMARAEAIRQAFDDGTQPAWTISAGVATMVPNTTERPDDLLRAADMALYAAKRAGRNRVLPATQDRAVGDLA
jgi:diguanylate cyclase (GGDEF)-like protein